EPHRAITIAHHRPDFSVRGRSFKVFGDDAAVGESIDVSLDRPDPDAAIDVAVQPSNRCVDETILLGVAGEAAVLKTAEAALGPDPDAAVLVSEKADDDVADQAVGGRVYREFTVLQPAEAAAIRSDPQTAVTAFGERPNLVLPQLSLVVVVKRRETDAVEPRNAAFRAEPY